MGTWILSNLWAGSFFILEVHQQDFKVCRVMLLSYDMHLERGENVLKKSGLFSVKIVKFSISVDFDEFLERIELPMTLHTCTPISELP